MQCFQATSSVACQEQQRGMDQWWGQQEQLLPAGGGWHPLQSQPLDWSAAKHVWPFAANAWVPASQLAGACQAAQQPGAQAPPLLPPSLPVGSDRQCSSIAEWTQESQASMQRGVLTSGNHANSPKPQGRTGGYGGCGHTGKHPAAPTAASACRQLNKRLRQAATAEASPADCRKTRRAQNDSHHCAAPL